MKVKVDDLAATVEKTLSDYAEDVNDIVKQEIKDAGKEAAKELKEKSPKRTGKYAKGWRSTVRKESAVGAEVVVHNKIYRLTHLLEKGYAKPFATDGRKIVKIGIKFSPETMTVEDWAIEA